MRINAECTPLEIMHACALFFGRDHFASIQELSTGMREDTITEKDIMIHLVVLKGMNERSVAQMMGIEPGDVAVSMDKVRRRVYKKVAEQDLRVTLREIARVATRIHTDGWEAAKREIEDRRTIADLEFFIGDCDE